MRKNSQKNHELFDIFTILKIAVEISLKHFYKVDFKEPMYCLTAADLEKRTSELINPIIKNLKMPYGMAQLIRKEIEKSVYRSLSNENFLDQRTYQE